MITHLVTGYAGVEHIQSADEGAFNAAFFGGGQYVMESGNQFEGSIVDNNTVRILDGDLLMYGRHVRIKPDTYEDLTITTGTAGTNRIDLICVTYEKNANDGTETAYFEVIKGTETDGTAVAPDYIDGNILEGATKNQMPMYKVTVEGVVLTAIESVFTTIPTYKTLAEKYAAEFQTACETHLGSLNVLDTMEEVLANTKEQQLAGALALKAMQVQHNNDLGLRLKTYTSLSQLGLSTITSLTDVLDAMEGKSQLIMYNLTANAIGGLNCTPTAWGTMFIFKATASQAYLEWKDITGKYYKAYYHSNTGLSDWVKDVSKSDLEKQVLTFSNVQVAPADWNDTANGTDYPYAAYIYLDGVTADHVPNVNFNLADSLSGLFASYADSHSGYINIYANELPEIYYTIPTIQCIKSV